MGAASSVMGGGGVTTHNSVHGLHNYAVHTTDSRDGGEISSLIGNGV